MREREELGKENQCCERAINDSTNEYYELLLVIGHVRQRTVQSGWKRKCPSKSVRQAYGTCTAQLKYKLEICKNDPVALKTRSMGKYFYPLRASKSPKPRGTVR